jgi:hypothetical protein
VEKGRIPELIARRIAPSAVACLCAFGLNLCGAGVASASTAVIKGQLKTGSAPRLSPRR